MKRERLRARELERVAASIHRRCDRTFERGMQQAPRRALPIIAGRPADRERTCMWFVSAFRSMVDGHSTSGGAAAARAMLDFWGPAPPNRFLAEFAAPAHLPWLPVPVWHRWTMCAICTRCGRLRAPEPVRRIAACFPPQEAESLLPRDRPITRKQDLIRAVRSSGSNGGVVPASLGGGRGAAGVGGATTAAAITGDDPASKGPYGGCRAVRAVPAATRRRTRLARRRGRQRDRGAGAHAGLVGRIRVW